MCKFSGLHIFQTTTNWLARSNYYKMSRGKPYTYYKKTWAKPDIHYKMACQKCSSSPVASLQNASGSRRKKFQALSQNDMHDPILTRLISTKITTYRGHVASHFLMVIGGGLVELPPLRICQQLISMNHKVWKINAILLCKPKKLENLLSHTGTIWASTSWSSFVFFSTLFFLQNWSVEERCLQKERSHVLIYNMLQFCGGLPFCSCFKQALVHQIITTIWPNQGL